MTGLEASAEGHLVWAAQAAGVRIFRHGTAVAVASPSLSGRDRIAVAGEEGDAIPLVRDVLREVGPTYRPFGEAGLVGALVREIDGLEPGGRPFWWMETADAPGITMDVGWLDEAGEKEASGLLDRYFPDSYAQPGRAGVRRWAGTYDDEGWLLAVAADAWSAARCGFLAGVVTHPRARGRGLGVAVSRFVVDALVRDHGRAALMVDADNGRAVAAYERVGMGKVLFAAAAAA